MRTEARLGGRNFRRIEMNIYIFLVVVQALIASALVGVILMQQSEGGGLGMGGSPTGLMSARGAASFLTRATSVLATLFVVLSIVLAALATSASKPQTVPLAPVTAPITAGGAATDPLTGAAPAASAAAPATPAATGAGSPLDLPTTKQ
jgi:preprotein translocase subunit SecG